MKLILQPIVKQDSVSEEKLQKRFDDLDLNTGNLLFTTSVERHLKGYESINWNRIKEEKYRNCTKAVIPCANFIIPGRHKRIQELTDLYKMTDFPITLLGLGAQAEKDCTTPKNLVRCLEKETVYLFKMASERSASIGVRGEFTAECLNEMGIKNVEVIGCPSFYFKLSSQEFLQQELLRKPTLDNIVFNITRNQEAWPLKEAEAKMLKLGMNIEGTYIMQMLSETTSTPILNKLCPKKDITVRQALELWPSKIRFFLDYDSWKTYLKNHKFSFCVGSRFHGNMMALHAGIPTLWIIHDMRTSELVKTLHLPGITCEKILNLKSLEDVLQYCDYREMLHYEKIMYRKYIEFLDHNHLENYYNL